ncbi:hypothetical protein KBX37_30305 [Micromonospora sp. U56]|uniref:hypothetical protein n=1 Tax=Micromonospora sp. U56 TaxID=2824900 RepID=UPI001B3860E3|nr:hypothetical protein [Micromonospora sp. U56]MBQ0897309.1 hypothetical protein [Micromonospora sp. U56]
MDRRYLAQFLGYAADDAPDLHPLLHFMAYLGPRCGEACGLLDAEVRLGKGEVSIVNQIATTATSETLPYRVRTSFLSRRRFRGSGAASRLVSLIAPCLPRSTISSQGSRGRTVSSVDRV